MKLAILLTATAALLAITNPGEDAYTNWIAQRMQINSCRDRNSSVCQMVGYLPEDLLKPTLKQYSYRQNFIFFSVYTTNFFGIQKRGVGICGYFFSA